MYPPYSETMPVSHGRMARAPAPVEACGKKVLLDMGSGSLSQLQRTEDLAALDMIVVSHCISTHMGDLFCAKYQLETRRAWGETVPKIPLLAPAWRRSGPGRSLAQGKCLTSARVDDGACFTLGGIRLTFIRLEHFGGIVRPAAFCTGQKNIGLFCRLRPVPAAAGTCKGRRCLLCEAPLTGAAGRAEPPLICLQRPRAFLLPSTMHSGCC